MEDALREQRGEDPLEEMPDFAANTDEYDPFTLPKDFDRSLALRVDTASQAAIGEKLLSGKDTDEKLDDLYEKLVDHGETLARLAMELDPGKAPRAFEVMNAIYKNAMDAVTSKRDHELKTMRLMLDQKKLDHEINANPVEPIGETEAVVAVMTTADLVRKFRKEMEEAPSTEARLDPTG